MSEPIRISAKNLGEVAMPGFCPRCFWLRMKAKKLPFQIFPGIFSSIDSYTKKVIHGWFDENNAFPPWLNDLGCVVSYRNPPHYSKFQMTDTDSNVVLWGTPDAIFVRADGSFVIADYKTARFTPNQDTLLPMYQVQLNAYAVIGEHNGFKPVSGLALVYMEPVTGADAAGDGMNRRDNGFAMGFQAGIHEVMLAPAIIPPLLAKTREIYELEYAPDGCDGCLDCDYLEGLFSLLQR